jgi:Carboxypeptidase regulatory-like domain
VTPNHLPTNCAFLKSRKLIRQPHRAWARRFLTADCHWRILLTILSCSLLSWVLLLALLFPTRGLAAGITGSLSGNVTDLQGAAVAQAQIKLVGANGKVICQTVTDADGVFTCPAVEAGQAILNARAPQFAPVEATVRVVAGKSSQASLQFRELASQRQSVTIVASSPSILTPDPSERVIIRNQVLDANPGRPGAPISIPGLPIETASGGIKAPQYFAPGVAGDHGEPIAQYFRVGDYLFPNNLPANAHGNGYADPNFLIAPVIGAVAVDSGAFNVREGNSAVDLAASYEPKPRLNSFLQLTGDDRDFDVATGWSPRNHPAKGWVAIEASFGNGFLKRLEHRNQYKLNFLRHIRSGRNDLTLFGIGYYGFSWIPGLIPMDVPVPDDSIDNRQLDRTHDSLLVASDTWQLNSSLQFLFSGFFRTYSLQLRSNFGDGLIQQSEFRTVAGGEAAYVQRIRPWMSFLAGVDLRRDAPRDLDLKHLDPQEQFQLVTSNDLTLSFAEPFASVDGRLGKYFHYDLGGRQEEVNMDNEDKINAANSFNKLATLTLPKATFTVLAPQGTPLPSATFSYGEAFHTNDPRIGNGTAEGTLLAPSRAFQIVLRKRAAGTDFKVKLTRVTNAQELAKIDPDTGLQEDVGPSLIRAITVSAQRDFRQGTIYTSFARAIAQDRLTGEDVPEAPRLIWDAEGSLHRLPMGLRARGEFEYVGRKPLGDGFTAVPVREIRGAVLRPLSHDRMSVGIDFLLASGYTGQTLETLALPDEPAPFERIVGVPLKSYVSLTWTYNFRKFLF